MHGDVLTEDGSVIAAANAITNGGPPRASAITHLITPLSRHPSSASTHLTLQTLTKYA